MRISELAERSGVSVPTIKYYLREGLLPPGRKLGERLSEYDDHHVRRLRLLRVLREVGAVPVDGLKRLVEAVDDRSGTVHEMFGAACDALARTKGDPPAGPAAGPTPDPEARALADRMVDRAGWTRVRPDAPARDRLADVLGVILGLGAQVDPDGLATYLDLVDALAAFELDQVDAAQGRDTLMERMVIGQVVFGELLMGLRRLAEEHYSAGRFGGDPPG